jgi:signal transduction histidine kinase
MKFRISKLSENRKRRGRFTKSSLQESNEEAQRNLERIRALHEIDLAITSTLDLRTILDVLLEKIELILPIATATTIRLLNHETAQFESLACRGMDEEKWNSNKIGGRARKIVATKAPLAVLNLDADPLTYNHEFFRKHGLVSYLGVPLIAKGKVLGVLGLYTGKEHDFSKEDIEFLNTLAGQAAIAIDNAQLFEEVVNANKVKEDFLGVMSHELRTPLSVIMGYTGLVKDGMLGEVNDRQVEALKKVLRRTDEQLAMINDIMQTTQLDSRSTVVERMPIDISGLLDALRQDYDLQADRPAVALLWDYPARPLTMTTDGEKLKQILQNLINNALKFTDEGTVAVSAHIVEEDSERERHKDSILAARLTSHVSKCVEFKVTDTGIGIPKEKHGAIFEKFHQVDSSETRLYGGVGLGLYIVKNFTALLGGRVEVESEPGKGSTFTVRIPA